MNVSVIIPAYNSAHYILRALDSVRRQTAQPTEIIVVDDGSTDETSKLLSDQEGILLIRQKNAGPAEARNVGVAQSKGAYIAFLDADDEWLPEKLEGQLAFMKDGGYALSFTDSYYDRGGVRSRYSQLTTPRQGHILVALLRRSFITMNTVMMERSLWEKYGGFRADLRIHEDYELWLRMAAGGEFFAYLNEPLAIYYAGHASSTSNLLKTRESHLDTLEQFLATNRGELPLNATREAERAIEATAAGIVSVLWRQGKRKELLPYLERIDRPTLKQRLLRAYATL